ncbi:hypothetical protein [Ruminococcus sp.]|uniref:hypothetical protein n=1 Tax=Ruminococcus sp. TaxID=41978 RepID=UPI0025EE9843|nr:hypothetical protein [Ruminococcus sp.]MBQ8965645.1 hypothetical protein [Ruminococcus sp.]
MKLLKIERTNSLPVNLIHSLAYGSVLAYIIMAGAWFIGGMRLSLVQCWSLWVVCMTVIFCLFGTFAAYLDIRKHLEIEELAQHRLTKGYDDEYFQRLQEFLGGELDDSRLLTFASMYLEGGRYADCRRQLEELDFAKLSSAEQEEYFNICLYSAVLEGDTELANDIYRKARRYFDRAVMGRRGGYVLHTLAMLCLLNGRYDNAYRLFQSAMQVRDDSLRCECCLGLGRLYLMSSDRASAKDMCYAAADLVETRAQAVRLKELMLQVEKAYGRKDFDDMNTEL